MPEKAPICFPQDPTEDQEIEQRRQDRGRQGDTPEPGNHRAFAQDYPYQPDPDRAAARLRHVPPFCGPPRWGREHTRGVRAAPGSCDNWLL